MKITNMASSREGELAINDQSKCNNILHDLENKKTLT